MCYYKTIKCAYYCVFLCVVDMLLEIYVSCPPKNVYTNFKSTNVYAQNTWIKKTHCKAPVGKWKKSIFEILDVEKYCTNENEGNGFKNIEKKLVLTIK